MAFLFVCAVKKRKCITQSFIVGYRIFMEFYVINRESLHGPEIFLKLISEQYDIIWLFCLSTQ